MTEKELHKTRIMKKRWVVCLGAGESQVSLIKNIRSIGYSVLAIDRNPDSSGFKYANEIKSY